MTDIAIRTERLTRDFDGLRAVDSLSLQVPQGTIFGFLGPNAASRGDSAMVSLLLNAGVNPEAANSDSVTPLMLAAKRGYIEVTKALINAGADVNAADKDGKPLLMHSMDLDEYVEVIRLLIAAGANVNAAMPDGGTALQHAKDKGRTEIAALLKEAGARE